MAATIQLAVLALALGLDSFRVSLGVGAAGRFRGLTGRLVCAFGVCDGVAFAVGVALGRSLAWMAGGWVNALGPPALAAYALYVLWLARKGTEDGVGEGRLVLGLPLVLSFDNLAVGGTLGGLSVSLLPATLVVGAASAVLALAGLALGRRTVEVLRLRPELAGATLLLAASALSFYGGG
jgi:manganese efflux pump family protein